MKSASPALIAYLAEASENPKDMQVFLVDLYEITMPTTGTIIRLNTSDRTLKVAGFTYYAASPQATDTPVINRVRNNAAIGLKTTELEVEFKLLPTMEVDGLPILNAMVLGRFDGAEVEVRRLIMPTWGDMSLGTIGLFSGFIADISDIGRTSCAFTVRSWTDVLNVPMPRNLFTPGCRHILFSAGCGLNAATFTVSGTVGPGATFISIPTDLTEPGPLPSPVAAPSLAFSDPGGANLIPETYWVAVTYVNALGETLASPQSTIDVPANNVLEVTSPPAFGSATGYNVYIGLAPSQLQRQNGATLSIGTDWTMPPTGIIDGVPPPFKSTSGYFSQGVITFTSGANSGLSYAVDLYFDGGIVTLVRAAFVAPSDGDTFDIRPGCDKQLSTCIQKFNNKVNFGGMPFIPQPEYAI